MGEKKYDGDYVNSELDRPAAIAAANDRAKALTDTKIITPGEGMGLAGRIKAMRDAKAAPSPTPTATATPTPTPKPFKITSPMDSDITKVK